MINHTKLRDNVFIKSGGLVKHGCQVCLVTGTVATCSQSRNSFTLPPRTITPSRVQAAASAGIVNTASGAVRCLSSPVRYSDTCTVVECRLEKCSSVDVFKKYLVLVPPPPASRGRVRRWCWGRGWRGCPRGWPRRRGSRPAGPPASGSPRSRTSRTWSAVARSTHTIYTQFRYIKFVVIFRPWIVDHNFTEEEKIHF